MSLQIRKDVPQVREHYAVGVVVWERQGGFHLSGLIILCAQQTPAGEVYYVEKGGEKATINQDDFRKKFKMQFMRQNR